MGQVSRKQSLRQGYQCIPVTGWREGFSDEWKSGTQGWAREGAELGCGLVSAGI